MTYVIIIKKTKVLDHAMISPKPREMKGGRNPKIFNLGK